MAFTESDQWNVSKLATLMFIGLLSATCHSEHSGVSDLRVGAENSEEAFAGQELPITAHIAVHAPIKRADVEIRPVSGKGWTFAQQYTESLKGKTHARFEARIGIPDTAEMGDYLLVLRITDTEEHVSEDTARFRLAIDSTVPTASDLDVGINKAGNDLHLETELTVPAGIAGVRVEIRGDAWSDTFNFSGNDLVGQLTHRFHEHVKVGEAPKGTHAVHLTVRDRQGREYKTEGTFTK